MDNSQNIITNANKMGLEKRNVPTLRFAEYTDQWRKYALSDFVTRIKRRNKNNESSLPLTISAQYGLVDQITFFNKTVASVDLSGYYLLYNGDFAYNKSYSNDYAWGAVKRLDKYEKGCLSSLYFVFHPTDKVDSDYLTHYFETSKWHKGISDIAGEGARNHGLLNMAVGDFFATKHYLPSLSEQKKIACFLNLITKRIEIQNKIIEDLKVLKKELCNRYFTSIINDTSLKYVTLKDILTERKEYCSKDGTFTHGTLSKDGVFPKTERYDRDFLVKNEDKQYKVTHFNDICYNPANLKFGVICRNAYGDLIFSPIYVTFEIADTVYPTYIELFLTNANFIGRIRRYEQGTVYERMAVSPEDFLSYETHMPTYEEQVKFADKIQYIQDKIELETLFLNSLQKQRKYLLNAMFI